MSFGGFGLTLAKVDGVFNNFGTTTIGNTITATAGGQVFNNDGTFHINGGTVNLSNGTFNQDGGTLAVASALNLTTATFNANGGDVNGTVKLTSSGLNYTSSTVGGTATFEKWGRAATNTISGDIPATHTIWLRSTGDYSYVTAAQGFTNYGKILFDAPGSNWALTLTVATGTLTNMGTLTVGEGSALGITANIDNHGTFELGPTHPLNLSKVGGIFNNFGTATIGNTISAVAGGQVFNNDGIFDLNGGTLNLNNGTFNQDGGTLSVASALNLGTGTFNANGGDVNGTVKLTNSGLNYTTSSVGGTATFEKWGRQGGNTHSGDIPATHTMSIRSSGDYSYVTAADGFTNYGTILFEAPDSTWSLILTVATGTLTNVGEITFGPRGSAWAEIDADLDNFGDFNVTSSWARFDKTNGTFRNYGTMNFVDGWWMTVANGSSLVNMPGGTIRGTGAAVSGGAVLNNGGILSPGLSTGTITIDDTLFQSSTAIIALELAGLADFDKLIVQGTANLGGTLQAATVGGYTPLDGDTFRVMTFGSKTGDFETTRLDLGNGFFLSPVFSATALDLTTVGPATAALSVTNVDSADPVTAGTNATYTLVVTNNGPESTTDAVLLDTLPPGFAFVSAGPAAAGCAETGGVVTCNLPTLLGGTSTTVRIVATTPSQMTTFSNTAYVSSASTYDPDTSDNVVVETTEVILPVADLRVTVAGLHPALIPGETQRYTVRVRNNGPDTATGVVLTNRVVGPPNSAASVVTSSGTCDLAGPGVVCDLGSLTSGALATVTFNAIPASAGIFSNDAEAAGTSLDPVTANNFDIHRTSVSAPVTGVVGPPPMVVTQISEAETASGNGSPYGFVRLGATVLFAAGGDGVGFELWKTDGTAAGTVLVKDINPGPATGLIGVNFSEPFGGHVYFNADDGIHGEELWKTDGTPAGTVMVKDIRVGAGLGSEIGSFKVSGGSLFFQARDNATGFELWKTDGTTAGTVLVKDIVLGVLSSRPTRLTDAGGVLFFTADDGSNGVELWRSDGTQSGTTLVKDIYPGPFGSSPFDIIDVGGTAYFGAQSRISNVATSSELWKSDGTESGTFMVRDIYPGFNSGFFTGNFTDVGGTVFFTANDGSNGWELWKSNGTTTGTVLVKDISPGFAGSNPNHLTEIAGTLYFSTFGAELWKTDGTEAGTLMVKDFDPNSSVAGVHSITEVGGDLFIVYKPSLSTQIWKSDGTEAGTVLVKDIYPVLHPAQIFDAGGFALFQATDPANGNELWRSDGTSAGTMLLKDIFKGTLTGASHSTNELGIVVELDGTLFFIGTDYRHSEELWRSDGTLAGTSLVKDIHPTFTSNPRELSSHGNWVYLVADDGTHGSELWRSDGTTAGTVIVKDIYPGSGRSTPRILDVSFGDTLYFTADDGVAGRELWRSGGEASGGFGTFLVKDIHTGPGDSSINFPTVLGNSFYFGADDGVNGNELWKSDGTAAGTEMVIDIDPAGSSNPSRLVNVGGTIFFGASSTSPNTTPPELWKSDGTAAGTVLLKPESTDGQGWTA